MLFINYYYYEIKDRNAKSGRFLKSGIILLHCVGRYQVVICSSLVNFQSFSEFSVLNLECSNLGKGPTK